MVDIWRKYKEKLIIFAILSIALVLFLVTRSNDTNYASKYEGYDLTVGDTGRGDTYSKYLQRYSQVSLGNEDIPIDIFLYESAEGVSELSGYEGESKVLLTEEDSYLEYIVNVRESGLYNIYMEYYPIKSRGIDIERSLEINGVCPFLGADTLAFHRVWGNATNSVRVDNQGNEIRPTQVEWPRWESTYFKDYMGYFTEPYKFYLEAGENKIRLTGINEPMAIRKLEITAISDMKSYNEYIKGFDINSFKNSNLAFMDKIQGEKAQYRSSPSLYAVYDRSSGQTDPASASQIKLNMIGGQSWRVAGQWIEWEVDVPEDGMYRISLKTRQSHNRGFVSNRSIMIDGEIPCVEVASVPFRYDNKWKLVTLSDYDGNELYFPLTKGTHTIRASVTLGELGKLLDTMEESIYRLNEMYRKILVLTGSDPDKYRDYRVEVNYPEVITAMELESRILFKLADNLSQYAGERSPQTASVYTLARQLEMFVTRPDKIPTLFNNFKDNIGNLGNGLLALSESQLDVDYIVLSAADAELPVVKETFLTSALHEAKSFFASFFVDYNNLGDVYDGTDVVQIWMLGGRDQSTIIKSMIDDNFIPETGIRVNVKLVALEAVMPAIVAGTGPDAVLSVGQGDPVNFAVRKAAVDLSQFTGFDEVASQFTKSAIVPYQYNGGVYALPETQNFSVMFYRKDILNELEIEPPDTWKDLIHILPLIQKNNMNVGIPSVATSENPEGLGNFLSHLYQRGGTLFNEHGSRTLLDGEIAVDAFDVYTKFFTHYKTPTIYDFVNRFRTGEIPLGFADYTLFNTLQVFAPEIRGLWDFALISGTENENGEINRSVSTGGLAAMMFSNVKNKELTWEFLKWWVSTESQVRFGRELESIMGAAARYPTANLKAFEQLAWGANQMAVLSEQRSWTVGTPEIPGGYYVSRHIINAARKVLNSGVDTRETLLDYSQIINDELEKKRIEFGLE